MPVIRPGVSHWTDPDSAVDEIQWFLAQFSTAYRGSVVLTRSEYHLATALNSLSCLHSYELSIYQVSCGKSLDRPTLNWRAMYAIVKSGSASRYFAASICDG
jgi:hypothetical protein